MIYIICGPTGSGKTSTAIEIAHLFNAPIVNADAFQIYQDMNIGTAKIDKHDPDYQRHYLLDIITPEQSYSVKQYQDDFRRTIDELLKNYKNIVVCGGTGLYIRAAIYDYVFEEQEQDDVSDLEKLTNEQLYELLKEVDLKATETIHMNNRKRVIRAISIARTNKVKKSENIENQTHELIYPKDEIRIMMLSPNREQLYENINRLTQGFKKSENIINKRRISRRITNIESINMENKFSLLSN